MTGGAGESRVGWWPPVSRADPPEPAYLGEAAPLTAFWTIRAYCGGNEPPNMAWINPPTSKTSCAGGAGLRATTWATRGWTTCVVAAALWTGRLAAIAAFPANASDATISPVEISEVVFRDLVLSKFMATS